MEKKIKTLDAERDHELIFPLSAFAFQYELSEAELQRKIQEAKQYVLWGMFVNGELAAKTHLLPLSVYINGKAFDMGGVSSVATWPEYRRNGLVKELMQHALMYMRQNGYSISILYPFSFAFYRRYGWELAFSHVQCNFPMDTFKKQWNAQGYVRRVQGEQLDQPAVLNQVYTTYAKQFSGMLKRDENWWYHRVLKDKQHIAVAYDTSDNPVGYIIYSVKKDVLTVKDFAFTDNNGRNLIYQFIGQHDSMAKNVEMTVPENDPIMLLADEPRFEQKITPYMMARIVDVQAFLESYPFTKGTGKNVTLHVEDDFVPQNSGTYYLNQTEEHVTVSAVHAQSNKTGIHCTIGQLTVMLLGYKRPVQLQEAGLIKGDVQQIQALDQLIPRQQPYIADFF